MVVSPATRRIPQIIFPAACQSLDRPPFRARLDISYIYRIDFNDGNNPDLTGIEEAVTRQLGLSLNMCDDKRRPRIAIAYSGEGHEISPSSELTMIFCAALGHSNDIFKFDATLPEMMTTAGSFTAKVQC